MLEQITWKDYLIFLMSVMSAYYIIVAAVCYRKEIKNAVAKKRFAEVPDQAFEGNEETAFEELEAIVSDIKTAVLQPAGTMAGKHELLDQLSARLENYNGLRRPAFKDAINNYIIIHAKEICGVVFSEEELNAAWRALLR